MTLSQHNRIDPDLIGLKIVFKISEKPATFHGVEIMPNYLPKLGSVKIRLLKIIRDSVRRVES